MSYEKITVNMLNEILYANDNQPVFKHSFGRLKNYEFLENYIPFRLLEYKNPIYNTAKIWGKVHHKSALSKLLNKEFVPKLFYEQVFKALQEDTHILPEIQIRFRQEWIKLKGDTARLKDALQQVHEFQPDILGQQWVSYADCDCFKPEILLTLLLLYAILSEKALLLFPFPVIGTEIEAQDTDPSKKNPPEITEDYTLVYYSGTQYSPERLITSRLILYDTGAVVLYNNYDKKSASCEYVYKGEGIPTTHGFTINLKSIISDEFVTISLIKSLGDHQRYLGLILALSASITPVCLKVACFKEADLVRVNWHTIKNILHSENLTFRRDLLTYEESAKLCFFSDDIFDTSGPDASSV